MRAASYCMAIVLGWLMGVLYDYVPVYEPKSVHLNCDMFEVNKDWDGSISILIPAEDG